MSVRVLLADDQALLRGTFRILLEATPGIEVVGEASDGADAVDQVRRRPTDVVVMDIRMPGLDGIEATRIITADKDLAGVRVLVLTTFETDEHVAEALRAGASGFVGKGIHPQELIDAIRTVAAGDALLSPVATRSLIQRFLARTPPARSAPTLETLTGREREVVMLAATGLSNDEIADHLGISVLTAKTHVNRAMVKLGARDRAHLVIAAYEGGLVHPAR
ncbi:response regulator transcription factor [Streptomyces sp. NBC_00102]|uniref:response regulator transcription factor n=1 Tax=Streptomyces sp. NBC_00102 TaxID=2975652 RepID=UPI002254A027|nr:response regulator transcription factor [Streptomyces sp. NBC_00102]MCX5396827.1 response regulator transcription factor [Streptomyces sp. NBC_00102]